MPKALKWLVIQEIFDDRFDPKTKQLSETMVTQEDVRSKLQKLRIIKGSQVKDRGLTKSNLTRLGLDDSYLGHPGLSANNIPNFFKDIVRNDSRNKNWPASVFKRGYAGKQAVGDGNSFEFIKRLPGQKLPFPETLLDPELLKDVRPIESLSLNISSRRLGRTDESWLTSVVEKLRLVETHLALHSSQKVRFVEALQTNVKLRKGEIDSFYLAGVGDDDLDLQDVLVSVETKHRHEVVEEEQVFRCAQGALDQADRLDIESPRAIPMAVKVLKGEDEASGHDVDGLIQVIEYEMIDPDSTELVRASEQLYRLTPPVKGINAPAQRKSRKHSGPEEQLELGHA